MKLYVDGNDLLDYFTEQQDALFNLEDEATRRENLARWLARYCELSEAQGVLIFDDNAADAVLEPVQHVGDVTVKNLPYGADIVLETAGPANRDAIDDRVFVVTADHHLARAAERGRARVQAPEQFVARARRMMHKEEESSAREPDEKFTGLTDGEVEFWVDYFRDEG